MHSYIVYDKNTGQIKFTYTISGPSMVPPNINSDEGILEGSIDEDIDCYIKNGLLVTLPAKPSPYHVFDYASEVWVDSRSLEDVKNAIWDKIKLAREQVEYGGFIYQGMVFDSDEYSQNKIYSAVQLALITGEAFFIDWTLADNSVVSLNKTQIIEVGKALGAHISSCHAHARILRSMIESVTTIDELEKITWDSIQN